MSNIHIPYEIIEIRSYLNNHPEMINEIVLTEIIKYFNDRNVYPEREWTASGYSKDSDDEYNKDDIDQGL